MATTMNLFPLSLIGKGPATSTAILCIIFPTGYVCIGVQCCMAGSALAQQSLLYVASHTYPVVPLTAATEGLLAIIAARNIAVTQL